MPRKSDSGRVVLDESAKSALELMLDDLSKEEYCVRVSSSKLVSWIVEAYAKSSFAVDKDAIVKKFFNSKEYLKNVIRGVHSSQEIEAALKVALIKLGSDEGSKRPRGRQKQKISTSNDNGSS